MSLLAWILTFTALGGVLSALAASVFLVAPAPLRARALPHLVSFATGALLSAALLGLLPHAIEAAGLANTHRIGLTVLVGLLIFFVLEKLVLWRHCHQDLCEGHFPHAPVPAGGSARDVHPGHSHRPALEAGPASRGTWHEGRARASATLILLGDGFHNVLDGVLIAAAFMTDLHLGVVTALAVFTHEIPQEVGDLAILLDSGMSRLKAMMLNLATSLTSILGGLIAYFALGPVTWMLPYAVAIAASSFLYIAVADLIPGLHRRVDPGSGIRQFVFILLGVAVIYIGHGLAH
jgi:zinc and cadmium transporter